MTLISLIGNQNKYWSTELEQERERQRQWETTTTGARNTMRVKSMLRKNEENFLPKIAVKGKRILGGAKGISTREREREREDVGDGVQE